MHQRPRDEDNDDNEPPSLHWDRGSSFSSVVFFKSHFPEFNNFCVCSRLCTERRTKITMSPLLT